MEASIFTDSRERVRNIIARYGNRKDSLISILQDIQTEYHYLPEEALREVAASLNLPLIQVFGVATFFKAFSLEPQGKHKCTACLGTACHVRGAQSVLDELERQLGIKSGTTSKDMEFTLESVNCLGACALGPVIVLDGEHHGQMTAGKVKKIFLRHKKAPRQKDEKATIRS